MIQELMNLLGPGFFCCRYRHGVPGTQTVSYWLSYGMWLDRRK